jgi:hypothetical protein
MSHTPWATAHLKRRRVMLYDRWSSRRDSDDAAALVADLRKRYPHVDISHRPGKTRFRVKARGTRRYEGTYYLYYSNVIDATTNCGDGMLGRTMERLEELGKAEQ